MKFTVILILSVITLALAKPQFPTFGGNPRIIPILKYTNEPSVDGTYNFNYQTGNGISVDEAGYLKNRGNPQAEAQVMQGSYSYTGPDGVLYTIRYIADENGFRAQGAHIPTPPPIPDAIARSLQQPRRF